MKAKNNHQYFINLQTEHNFEEAFSQIKHLRDEFIFYFISSEKKKKKWKTKFDLFSLSL